MDLEIIDLLKSSLDLNDKETIILKNILIKSEQTAHKLSKETGYSRSEIYDITSKLKRKELIQTKKLNNVLVFSTTQEILKSQIEYKSQILENAFNLINKFKEKEDLKIDILTGRKNFNLIGKDMIKNSKKIYIWNYGINSNDILSFGSKTYLETKILQKKVVKIKTYYLVPKGINPVTGPNYIIKKYKAKKRSPVAFWLYGNDYLVIGLWQGEGTYIKIKNKKIYDSFLESFKIAFNDYNI